MDYLSKNCVYGTMDYINMDYGLEIYKYGLWTIQLFNYKIFFGVIGLWI
jgi:hypothetical protein